MTQYLQLGSFGEAVRQLQAALNQLQSSQAKLKEDAQFGSKTHGRVMEFQQQNRLTPDGVAGPQTFAMLDQLVKTVLATATPPVDMTEARGRIVSIAQAHLTQWGGAWNSNIDVLGVSQKVAGKLCIDPTTRFRQGGAQIGLFFSTMGVPNAHKCITISEAAVKMYNRPGGYTASERNNTDIASWCGIFAFYILKLAGLKRIPDWSQIKIYGISTEGKNLVPKDRCHMMVTANPQKGDIGVVGAREVRDSAGNVIIKMGQNHHFIVTDVTGGSVSSVDGNSGALMEILSNSYSVGDVLKSGGFYTPIWENCV